MGVENVWTGDAGTSDDSLGYDWGYGSAGAPGSAGEEPTIDPNPGDGTPGPGWGGIDWSKITTDKSFLDTIKGLFTGSTGGALGQLAAFGGLAALLRKLAGNNTPPPVGYQGGIPEYTVSRTQTPMSEQRPVSYESVTPKPGEAAATVMRPVPYRPGQGGITYFRPMQYNYTGRDLAAPTASSPATGGITGGTSGGSNAGIDTGGSVATPGYTGPVTIDGTGSLIDPRESMNGGYKSDAGIQAAAGGYMPSGIAMLAAGGNTARFLRGPGDGVSDSIHAKFDQSGRPARLADGEFVIDARTVSEIGNGSSEAGARKLYAMMDRVQKARRTAKRGEPSKADKYLPK